MPSVLTALFHFARPEVGRTQQRSCYRAASRSLCCNLICLSCCVIDPVACVLRSEAGAEVHRYIHSSETVGKNKYKLDAAVTGDAMR